MHTFEFWIDQGAVKKEEDFQEPDAVANGSSVKEAALLVVPKLVNTNSNWFFEVIVRNATTNRWFTLGLSKEWTVSEIKETTLAEVLKDFES